MESFFFIFLGSFACKRTQAWRWITFLFERKDGRGGMEKKEMNKKGKRLGFHATNSFIKLGFRNEWLNLIAYLKGLISTINP